ncbi:MAG: MurR/RpiR family transcriptional regulator [Erysipelotrichaceae bacterium]|nr:MurR/RpiR family transcriptional regulator [Erysipelotrichaceae bacterium]
MDNTENNNEYRIFRFNLLTSLLAILNKNDENDTDFVIAKYILSNLNDIPNTSIYKIADDCFVSRSSVQRFIKNIGYDSFTQMKQSLGEVILHEGALLDYTDHTEYSDYILNSINAMTNDIAKSASSKGFRKLVDYFVKARCVVILSAEDSAHACKLLQQQVLATGKLIRIMTSAYTNISLLDSLSQDDLLLVCSISGNFALAINDQLNDVKATKCLITLNRTTSFVDNYSLIYYIGEDIKPSSHKISMLKNVYTTYGLMFLFDLFYHEFYLRYNKKTTS